MNTFTVKIQRTGTIPIPEPLCRTLGIKPGDRVNVTATRGRIILTAHPERQPATYTPTEADRAAIKQGRADLKSGRYVTLKQLSSALKPRPLELIGKQSKRNGRE
jgi:AbrB family looped-hinge helix DNA binding protein